MVLWESSLCRIVRVADPDYPGFCRVIWTAHSREMTDLEPTQRHYLMTIVFTVEEVLRELLSPDKINLASFGNMTPHLHWHVIPRWQDDRHFPEPIWGRVHGNKPLSRTPISDQMLIQALRLKLPSGDPHA
ncbi:MAG: HIT family protein [Rhodocyclaceae bacterium]|nr:HIT family protein [Rhodocyclaceae bacterium]